MGITEKPANPNAAHLERALKCAECNLRDAVIANLKGNAYARPEDIEADLVALEAMPKG